MRKLNGLLLALTLGACTRDLSLPMADAVGSVSGRAVYAVPGRADLRPAVGALVSLKASGLSTATTPSGTFHLEGVEDPKRELLFQLDSDQDGAFDRQRTFSLEGFGVGPHRAVDLGDVMLGENAAVHGRVLRSDFASTPSGHGGTAVFVPQGPYSTLSSDNGSFAIRDLPSGPLQLFAFRTGYAPLSLGTVDLRPGEDFGFRDATLELSGDPPVPGALLGNLVFVPRADGAADSHVEVAPTSGLGVSGTVSADLGFSFPALEPGLYRLTATRSGYYPAVVPNVLVVPGTESSIGAVVLTDQPPPDAGQPAPPDAGARDAGAPDAGPPDGGLGPQCVSHAQCSSAEWCDQGACQPQCSTSAQCSLGRSCDLATGTCARPCSAGCAVNQGCVMGFCRSYCDLSFPCAPGFSCSGAGRCVPECGTNGPACGAHQRCHAGQCENDLTCTDDTDCPTDTLCTQGTCGGRPSSRTDAGTFACTNACQCRLGEWCSAGQCLPDPVPTKRLTADGGVDLESVISSLGMNEVVALRSTDRFYVKGPLQVTPAANRSALAGGYVECAPNRWVRSDTGRTTLAVDAGTAVTMQGNASVPVTDFTLQNLVLEVNGCGAQVSVDQALRPAVRFIDGRFLAPLCVTSAQQLVSVARATDLDLFAVTVGQSVFSATAVTGVSLSDSSGNVRGVTWAAQTNDQNSLTVVSVSALAGPLTISGVRLGDVRAAGKVTGIHVDGNEVYPLVIERSVLRWPLNPLLAGDPFNGIDLQAPRQVTVRDNLIDGEGVVGPVHLDGWGLHAAAVSGSIERNVVALPRSTTSGATRLTGISVDAPSGGLSITDNAIAGGDAPTSLAGIKLENLSGGPFVVARNGVWGGSADSVLGLSVDLGGASSPLVRIFDNEVSVNGHGGCGGTAVGAQLRGSPYLVERNRFFADFGGRPVALQASSGAEVELYANQLWSGRATCLGSFGSGLALNQAVVFASGNTVEAQSDALLPGSTWAIEVQGPGSQLFAQGNIFGGGSATEHFLINLWNGATVSALDPTNFRNNLFWYRRTQSGLVMGDQVGAVVLAPEGSFDAQGNLLAGIVNPFDPVQPKRPDGGTLPDFRLSATSQALDKGVVPRKRDGLPSPLDLEGQPRDAGLGPDIGCCERR